MERSSLQQNHTTHSGLHYVPIHFANKIMLNSIKQNKILIVSLVVVAIFFVWFSMSGKGKSTKILTSQSARTISNKKDREVLQSLEATKAIRLNNALFKTTAFKSLVDFGQNIIPEPIGRINPFSPVVNLSGDGTRTFSNATFGGSK